MDRIICLDVGDRRIGVAVSDLLGITAQGIETYTREIDNEQKDADYIVDLALKQGASKILFGMPRNMNGTYGPQADKVKHFAEIVLRKWNGSYDYYDERLTTVSAEKALLEADVSRKKRKNVIDKIAAVVILQGYLDRNGGY